MSIATHASKFAAPRLDAQGRVPLIGLELPELTALFESHGFPAFRAKQVWNWIYQRGLRDFEGMNNLPKEMRGMLAEKYSIERPRLITEQKSEDGTIKWLIAMADGQQVEMVYIPEDTRGTLCISSQVGCTLTCKFCHTGTQPLVRNLGPHEILQQIMYARDVLNEWPEQGKTAQEDKDLTNIVLMGMGEPLYNYANVAKGIRIAMDENGIGISKRRITLSTSGVVPQIKQCGDELGVNLAISLHATTDEQRGQIMPINNKYPLAELIEACRTYPVASSIRRITFEYVMLKDVNDTDDDARRLAQLLKGVHAKINLIPFNPWPGSGFECSSGNRMHAFAKIMTEAGYDSPIRKPRGRDILAACGQLKSESARPRASESAS